MLDSFYFLVHGETDWDSKDWIVGQQDIPLNNTGKQQAAEAAKILAGHPLASLCHSPLSRTTETSHIIATQCPCSLHSFPAFIERHWGVAEGKHFKLTQATPLPIGAENEQDFRRRVLSGFQQALSFPPPILLVAHQDVFHAIFNQMGIDSSNVQVAIASFVSKKLGKWNVEPLTESRVP